MNAGSSSLCWQHFGIQPYLTVWKWQKQLVQQRIEDKIPDTILIGEHFPVYTAGRRFNPHNLLDLPVSEQGIHAVSTHKWYEESEWGSAPVISVERGGDVTYHGPGQLLIYPIIKLSGERRDLRQHLRFLEQVIIDCLATIGIVAYRKEESTGVWVLKEGESGRKIASVGVAVKNWVTYHGAALNVCTDMNAFARVNPCGFPATIMTSVAETQQAFGAVSVTSVQSISEILKKQLKKAWDTA